MLYRENENSSLNQALRSLEQTYNSNKQRASVEPSILGVPPEYVQAGLKILSESMERVSGRVKYEVQKNPWSFLGKVALGSFALGLTLKKRHARRKSGKNE